MKIGDRVAIYPEGARRDAVSATVEEITPSGFSVSLKLTDGRTMVLSRTEGGLWQEVATGRRYEIEGPQHTPEC